MPTPSIITSRTRGRYERPPSGNLVVNFAHPSARGIVAAWPFGGISTGGGAQFAGFNVYNRTAYKLTNNNSPATRPGPASGYCTSYNGSNQDSELASTAVVGVPPCTIEAWFRSTSGADDQTIAGITNGDSGSRWLVLQAGGRTTGTPVQAYRWNTPSERFATSTVGYKTGFWTHGAAVFVSETDMFAMCNGLGYGADSFLSQQGTLNRTMIGAFRVSTSYFGPFFGDVDCVLIRNVAISPSEVRERADPALRYAWLHQLGATTYSFGAPAATARAPYYYLEHVAQLGPGGGF